MGITRVQALDCFASDDLIGIGMEADAVRRQLHPEGVVSYVIERTLPYARLGASGVSAIDLETLCSEVGDSVERGGTAVALKAPLHADLGLAWIEALLGSLRQRFPELALSGLSATTMLGLATRSGLAVEDVLLRLRHAGLEAMGADDAEMLDDSVRQRCGPGVCSAEDWLHVHRTAHALGMPTSAEMVFGRGESVEQRIAHLELLHRVQQETGGFTAFTPVSHQPSGARAGGLDEPTSVEFLKMLAISRMYLDNVAHIQNSWATQGTKVLQMGLRFGGNDVGSVMLENATMQAAGASNAATEEELRRLIRDAGFMPVQRDAHYRTLFLN